MYFAHFIMCYFTLLTLLGGAEHTRVSWEQGLSVVSVYFFYDNMLKDMCQAYECDSQ